MTVERLRDVLNRIAPPGMTRDEAAVTPLEIAEILWLAVHASGSDQDQPSAERPEAEEDTEAARSPTHEASVPTPPARRYELHLPSSTGTDEGGAGP